MSPKRKKKKQAPFLPLAMVAAGALLIIAAVVYLASQQGRTAAVPTVFPTAAANNRIPFPEIERVSLENSYTAWQSGEAVLVDTRGEPYYSTQHIPNALDVTDQSVPGPLADLPRDTWIITYCT